MSALLKMKKLYFKYFWHRLGFFVEIEYHTTRGYFRSLMKPINISFSNRDLKHPTITECPERVDELITITTDPYEACDCSHAIVVCTEWDEFTVSYPKTRMGLTTR